MNINSTESNNILKFNYRDLLIFLVPILIFLLYLFIYSPGVLTVASYSQLHQIVAGKFTTAHPILHTLIEMLFLKVFKSPFYIGLFQILVFSIMWMVICKYHRDDNSKNSNGFVIQFIITLIICLIPINAVYSITLSSTVLFSYSIMFLCFLIKVMLDKNGQIDSKLIILMAVTLGLVSGLNNYGICIALVSLILIAYYLIKKGASENTKVLFGGLAILCIFLIASLNFVYDVQGDAFNIPTDDAFENDIDLRNAQNQFFSIIDDEPSQDYEMITSANAGKNNYNLIDSYVSTWQENSILGILFNNPILYMILSIVLLALIYVRSEANSIFFVYVPALVNAIIAIITQQYSSYATILTFYLVVIICVSYYLKPNTADSLSLQPQAISQPKAYEDNYYDYLESELENLTLEDINEMLDETPSEKPQQTIQQQIPTEKPQKPQQQTK